MANDKLVNSLEQPKSMPEEVVWSQPYDPSEVPLTEDLLPIESPNANDISPQFDIVAHIKAALDVRARRQRQAEKALLAAKQKRVDERLAERDIYLSKYFR